MGITMNNIPHNWAGDLVRNAWRESGLSLRQIARQANTSHATLNAYIKGDKSPSTATLERVISACGYAIDVSLRPRVRFSNGIPRGEELAQVLTLAEQFPARHSKALDAPIFPTNIRPSA
jgi:transcriptional regulator with XRE-family HTH domain